MTLSAPLSEASAFLSETSQLERLITVNHVKWGRGWLDERTGEFFESNDSLLATLLLLEEKRALTIKEKPWWSERRTKDLSGFTYKHKASLAFVAKSLELRKDVVENLNKIYNKADCSGVGDYKDIRLVLKSKNWKRGLKGLEEKGLIKINKAKTEFMVSVDYTLARDHWYSAVNIDELKELWAKF